MADEIDLGALRAGEKDLVNADFREANLDGLNLSHRDFSGAKFQKATLRNANLRRSIMVGASFTRTDFTNANLDGCTIASTGFVRAILRDAILVNANFSRSIFNGTILAGADLRGADFSNARLVDDNDLTDAIVDEGTRFDGAHILRPMIKNPVFRFYRLERGRLIRKSDEEVLQSAGGAMDDMRRTEIQGLISSARQTLAAIVSEQSAAPQIEMMGHNNPPPEAAMTVEELVELDSALEEISTEVESEHPDSGKVDAAKSSLIRFGKVIADWAGKCGGWFFEEFAKEAGRNAAKPQYIAFMYLTLSGQLGHLLELIVGLFG